MPDSSFHFRRFLTRLHHRHLALHLIEYAGLGLASGAVLAMGAVALAYFLGRPAIEAVEVCLAVGLLGGVVAGWGRRPTLLDSAMEADRQLRLADLLSTACTVEPSAGGWNASLLAMAEARCSGLRPSQVVLKRWGGRTWGGLGIAMGLVLTVAMIVERPTPSQASLAPTDLFSPLAGGANERSPASSVADASETATPGRRGHVDDNEADANRQAETTAESGDAKTSEIRLNHDSKSSSGSDSGGGGMTKSTLSPQRLQMVTDSARPLKTADAGKGVVAGDGAAGGGNGTLGEAKGQTSQAGSLVKHQPWLAASSTDGNGLKSKVESQPAYAPYRNLIRAYFDREESH